MSTSATIGLVILVIGIILIGIEMILPGFGAPGTAGTIATLAGIGLMSDSIETALKTGAIVIVILAIMLASVVVLFHSRKIKSPLILEKELHQDPDYLSSQDLEYLVGKEGVTITPLRPAGKCDLEGVIFEVRSADTFIEKNRRVKIIKVQSNTLMVRECK